MLFSYTMGTYISIHKYFSDFFFVFAWAKQYFMQKIKKRGTPFLTMKMVKKGLGKYRAF
jgi:hypothetical protein